MEEKEDDETDGVNSIEMSCSTPKQPTKQTRARGQGLSAGFGFTEPTRDARPCYEINKEIEKVDETGQESNDKVSERDNENAKHSDKESNNDCEIMLCVFEDKISSDDTHRKSDITQTRSTSVEMDTILTECTVVDVLQEPPVDVPDKFVKIIPDQLPTEPTITCFCMIPVGIKEPEKKSKIWIPHNNADSPKGDAFGAYLCTLKDKLTDGSAYYRHFLVDVEPGGPAEQMKIYDNDELVLLADEFVPRMTHFEVLERFKAVKVDGITRFQLVIRRIKATKKWEWIETSAILAPEKDVGEKPLIERVKSTVLRGEQIEVPKTKHLYKVPGTQNYLDICNGKVSIKTLKGDGTDRTKVIWKRAKYYQADGDDFHINFAAALCDESMKWYIGFDKNKIVLQQTPVWFKMIMVGSKIRFQLGNYYIGYKRRTGEVIPDFSQCAFDELHAPNDEDDFVPSGATKDTIDGATGKTSEASFDYKSLNSSISSSISSTSADSRSIASSQHSVDSDRSSNLSSQVSIDSGGVFTDSQGSNYDDINICCLDSSLTPSQASKSSGYRSEGFLGDIDTDESYDTSLYKAEHICENQNDLEVSI